MYSTIPLPYSIVSRGGCDFNEAVVCWDKKECDKCGWNPRNIPHRKEAARQRLMDEGWQ